MQDMRSASTPRLFPPLILHAYTSADMFMAMVLMGLIFIVATQPGGHFWLVDPMSGRDFDPSRVDFVSPIGLELFDAFALDHKRGIRDVAAEALDIQLEDIQPNLVVTVSDSEAVIHLAHVQHLWQSKLFVIFLVLARWIRLCSELQRARQ